jgi:predicted TIM-barrel fold metal-dependent hydrolase
MYPFVFTHDAHVTEPEDLLRSNLPEKHRPAMLKIVREGDTVLYKSAERVLFHLKIKGDISRSADTAPKAPGAFPGGYDIAFRLREMEKSGVDATIVYNGLIGFAYALDAEPGTAHMRVFNDWCIDHFRELPNTFVCNAMLPAYDPAGTLAEFRRVLDLGYRSVMMPINPPDGVPRYPDPIWDPVWSLCEEAGIPMSMHSGTSKPPIRYHGAGAACMNHYTHGLDAQEAIAYMVVTGLFDRHPKLKLINSESGADWLAWTGERLDEAYTTHQFYVNPKLRRLPSETLYSQVIATTHRERGCLKTLGITGADCIIWSDDYPHAEGTYPHTQQILDNLFSGSAVAPETQQRIVGGTCAGLYGLDPGAAEREKKYFWASRAQS